MISLGKLINCCYENEITNEFVDYVWEHRNESQKTIGELLNEFVDDCVVSLYEDDVYAEAHRVLDDVNQFIKDKVAEGEYDDFWILRNELCRLKKEKIKSDIDKSYGSIELNEKIVNANHQMER